MIVSMLPEEQQAAILERLEREDLEDVEEIMSYADDSAGSVMTKETFMLNQNTTIKAAIAQLQSYPENEKVFYVYVVDDREKLMGVISLRNLVTSKNTKKLREIMIKDIHAVTSDTDQEEVAKIVAQYNYLALPVVNKQNRFLGIVTIDDIVDIIRQEASEDFLQMAGVGKDREILLKSPLENAQSRAPWIFASLIGGICAAAIIESFGELLKEMIVLAAFIPVIIGMGGNIGTQSSTIVVRGLATGRVDVSNAINLMVKEIIVGAILGALYGMLIGFTAEFIAGSEITNLGLVIGLSIALKKLDFDPAISTGPFVTTAIDILGVALYFIIATSILL